uniref:Uncharacterized protein LOC111099730 isoform X2 n=1 Tax=Crassostrea virginica TaxID=6565 RepID=A0A8B8AAF3_CRAVI|nr:uncharacterized protein LOC111099730 isoform X2 [Crassostrea virginica]
MDDFMVYVRGFFRNFKSYNTEQLTIFEIFLEAFNTYIEEILLAFHISVGVSESINVQDLLYQDFLEVFRRIQPGKEDKVTSYLQGLQKITEERLWSLHQEVGLFRAGSQKEEQNDLKEFLILASTIVHGITVNASDSLLKDMLHKMKDHQGTFSHKKELCEVDIINKRNLGKMIVRFIGHEGVEEKHGLRQLLQACIDYLQHETEEVWRSALITIYDKEDNVYKIASGDRHNKFICRMKKGEPFIRSKFGSDSEKHKFSMKSIDAHSHHDSSENEGWRAKMSRLWGTMKSTWNGEQ